MQLDCVKHLAKEGLYLKHVHFGHELTPFSVNRSKKGTAFIKASNVVSYLLCGLNVHNLMSFFSIIKLPSGNSEHESNNMNAHLP